MIEQFEINVYSKDLVFIGVIDDCSSLRWRRKYFEAGEFEIHIPYDERLDKFLERDNIIVRDDSIEAGIIEAYQIVDDEEKIDTIIVGRFLSSILDRRIIKEKINFSGPILEGERKLLSKMTPFSKLEISESDIETKNITFQCTYKNVYNYINKLSRTSGIAHRIIPDFLRKKFIYENYQGLDRTETQFDNVRYEFSEENGNIETCEYTFDNKTCKNYALVGGIGEDKNRIIVEVKSGEYNDFDLREIFIDAKTESKGELTDVEYKEILKNKGKENLQDITESIEVTAYGTDYKKRWDLGDIVNVKKESWNKNMKKRITEIEETIEERNQSIFVTFGDPLNESWEDNDYGEI